MHAGSFVFGDNDTGNIYISRTTFTFEMLDEFINEFFSSGVLENTTLYKFVNDLSLGEEYFNGQTPIELPDEILRIDADKRKNPVKYKRAKLSYVQTKDANTEAVSNYIKYLVNAAKFFLEEYIDLVVNEPNFEVILGMLLENKGILDMGALYAFQQDLSFLSDKIGSLRYNNSFLDGIEENDRKLFFGESRKTMDTLLLYLTNIFQKLWRDCVQEQLSSVVTLKPEDREGNIFPLTSTFLTAIKEIQGLGDLGTTINFLRGRRIYSISERSKYERVGVQFLKDKGVLSHVDSQLGMTKDKEISIYRDLGETSDFVKKHRAKNEACLTFILRRMGYKWITSDDGESQRNSFWKELTVEWANTDQFDNVTDVKEKIQEKMDSLGNGAIAMVSVKLGRFGSPYSFVAEQIHGEALFLDPRTGEKVSDKYLVKARSLQIDSKVAIKAKDKSIFSSSASQDKEVSSAASPEQVRPSSPDPEEPVTSSAASPIPQDSEGSSAASPELVMPLSQVPEEPVTLSTTSPLAEPQSRLFDEGELETLNQQLDGINHSSSALRRSTLRIHSFPPESESTASSEQVRPSSPVSEESETSSTASSVAESSSSASPIYEETEALSPAISPVVVAHKESDVMSDINEALRGANRNSKNTSDWGYENNCQRCCVAYELRRRGKNVVAKPFDFRNGIEEDELLINLFEQIPERVNLEGNGTVLIQNIKSQMEKWGNGSRAMISFTATDLDSGHCFIAEQVNGETVFLDPQHGKLIEDLNKNKKYFIPNRIISYASLAKIDKVKFTEDVINKCCVFEQS